MILLDTNVISEPMRPSPSDQVLAWLDSQVVETLYLSTLTLAEVRFGIAVLPDGRKRQRLHDRFESEIVPLFSDRLLAFDEQASTAYAALGSRARSAGRAIGLMDALIAAIAVSHRLTVATRDEAGFLAAGVEVVNPFVDDVPLT